MWKQVFITIVGIWVLLSCLLATLLCSIQKVARRKKTCSPNQANAKFAKAIMPNLFATVEYTYQCVHSDAPPLTQSQIDPNQDTDATFAAIRVLLASSFVVGRVVRYTGNGNAKVYLSVISAPYECLVSPEKELNPQ